MRARRAALSPEQAAAWSAVASQRLASTAEFARARHLAGYVAVRGEADPRAVLDAALASGKIVCLPRVVARKRLVFASWEADTVMRNNRFGIPEPESGNRLVAPERLDLVIVPLVAFDASAVRIGSGAGYYDRTFALRRGKGRPLLAGFAYAFQERPRLAAAEWDVPLDLVVTERAIRRFEPMNES